jgi:hypothetical protein
MVLLKKLFIPAAGNLSNFYDICKGLKLARNLQFPDLTEVFDAMRGI